MENNSDNTTINESYMFDSLDNDIDDDIDDDTDDDIDEETMKKLGLMNLYNIYYNKKNRDEGHMFNKVNAFSKQSVNDKMMSFYSELKKYNSDSINSMIYDQKQTDSVYELIIDNKKYHSASIITLLLKVTEYDWVNLEWNIT